MLRLDWHGCLLEDGNCSLRQKSKDGSSQNQPNVFKHRKIKQHQDDPYDDPADGKKKSNPTLIQCCEPILESGFNIEPMDDCVG